MACVRYLLFAFNLCILTFGVLLIYSGLSTFVTVGKYEVIVHNAPNNTAIVLVSSTLSDSKFTTLNNFW